MREKLIELLSQVQFLGGLEEKVADHLIANGVTIRKPAKAKPRKRKRNAITTETFLALEKIGKQTHTQEGEKRK